MLLNRSFWPDIEATGQFLTELCEKLVGEYNVTVIAGLSYYERGGIFKRWQFYNKETFNGIKILRVRHTRFWKGRLIGRITNWLTYSILAFIAALKVKPQIIIVCTDPPFLGIIGMLLSRLKSVPFIYNCRDLYPDVAVGLGKLKNTNPIGRIFDYFNKKAFWSASLVVCLGTSMKDRLIAKGIPGERIKIIPDWVDTLTVKPVLPSENPLLKKFNLADKFVIMYSGNIGLSQDFDLILHALLKLEGKADFYLVFIGEGAGKEGLKAKVARLDIKNVLFLPYQPLDLLAFSLSMASLHLVPLKKGMAGAVVPSKIYGIMAVARSYLAITDEKSEPALMAEEFKCGLWAKPGDEEAVIRKINWAINHPGELDEMGKAGRRLAEIRFSREAGIKEWLNTLQNS